MPAAMGTMPLDAEYGRTPTTYLEGLVRDEAKRRCIEGLVAEAFDGHDSGDMRHLLLIGCGQMLWQLSSGESDLLRVLADMWALIANLDDNPSSADGVEILATTIGSCHLELVWSSRTDGVDALGITVCDPIAQSMLMEDYRNDRVRSLTECLKVVPTLHAWVWRDNFLGVTVEAEISPPEMPAAPFDTKNLPVQRLFSDEGSSEVEVVGFDPNRHVLTANIESGGRILEIELHPVGMGRGDAMNLAGLCRMDLDPFGTVIKVVHGKPRLSAMADWIISRSTTPDLRERFMRCAPYVDVGAIIGHLDVMGEKVELVYSVEKGLLNVCMILAGRADVALTSSGIEIDMDMPQTMRLAYVGRPARELIDHPLMEGLMVAGTGEGSVHRMRFDLIPADAS